LEPHGLSFRFFSHVYINKFLGKLTPILRKFIFLFFLVVLTEIMEVYPTSKLYWQSSKIYPSFQHFN